MVREALVDDILVSVIRMVRNLKSSAGEFCSLFPITADDGSVSALSVTQLRPIIFLHQNGRSSVGEVAADSGVTLATASQMLDKLVETGWIERGSNPEDRRQVHVWLTEKAADVARQIHAIRREQVRLALELLDGEDGEAALRVFRAFNQSLEQIPTGIAASQMSSTSHS